MSERRVRRDDRMPFQELDGEVVIVSPARREVHQLNSVGSFLWNLLAQPRSASELAESLASEFEVERERAERDVRAFLEELRGKGLTRGA